MSRHEGVSCDSCSKRNFRGRRYKCLLCYDYDLCATCYEAGATTPRHTTEHPVQCILTRSDFDMYYGGESLTVEQPQSFTCPYCAKMGFTEATLQEHVTSEHSEASAEVVCPVCASLPGGDPNLVTDDLSGHLNLEHRSGRSDLISFLDEPSGLRHGIRRAPHASRGGVGSRPRRCNMHFTTSGGLSSISPSSQTSDPIAELLSQLSGVRRSAASVSGQGSTPSQLQQLQIQLQLERQQAARQQLERLPRRQTQPASSNSASNAGSGPTTSAAAVANSTATAAADLGSSLAPPANLQFLLARCTEPALTEAELQAAEQERADHSLFVQELVLSTLTEATASLLSPSSSGVVPSKSGGSSEACSSSRESPGGGGGARIQPPPPPPQASPSPSPSPAPPPAPAPTPPAPPAPSSSYSTSSNSPSSSVASATQQKTSAASAVSKRSSTRGSVAGSSPVTGSSSGARMPQPAQPALQQLWEGVTRPIVSLQDQPSPPQPQPLRVVTGTGTIREVVGAAYGTPATNRRKPVRTATEPPPPH